MTLFREMHRIYSKLTLKLGRIRISKRKQDSFANIPPEIIVDILSRLPIPSVMRCKCVCKSWMNLLESLEFAKSHISSTRLAPGEDPPLTLSLFHGQGNSKTYQILELVDTQNLEHPFNVVFKFTFPRNHNLSLHSSADGLLLMLDEEDRRNLYICNPIICEYIKLPPLPLSLSPPRSKFYSYLHKRAFGFGVSQCSGKYKVVRVSQDCDDDDLADPYLMNTSMCEVYTLGTGSWRSVAADSPHRYLMFGLSAFLNGNLHWLVQTMGDLSWSILCFDLEKEHLSTISIPFCGHGLRNLCTLRGRLCLCCNDHRCVEIWLMNEYGDEKSWSKLRFGINDLFPGSEFYISLVPQQMSKDGDILFAEKFIPQLYCCYSSKTGTVTQVQVTGKSLGYICFEPSVIYAPTFLPLRTFTMEVVTTF